MTDPIAAARALIEPLTGYTPGPWRKHGNGKQIVSSDAIIAGRVLGAVKANTRLIAAAPALRDMVATLADALEADQANVAAAYEAVANIARSHIYYDSIGSGFREDEFNDAIRALTPAAAQSAIDKMLAEARLEGWRAGRDAAAARCWEERGLLDGAEILTNLIRALPEPKETSHE